MRFGLVTTFFGAHRFGGDAAYVERLADALLQRGHEVEVFCSRDAFDVLRGGVPPLPYTPPPGLVLHAAQSRWPLWSLLHVHQTGGMGPYRKPLSRWVGEGGFDVLHLHNVSLLGATELMAIDVPGTFRLMTVHEHWLACPLSVRWRFNREPCPAPTCARCMLLAGRPPQWWRSTGRLAAGFQGLDAAIFPSESSLAAHRQRGIVHPRATVLPYFVPREWCGDLPADRRRDAFLFVGRLVKEKGLQQLLPLFHARKNIRLDVVGDGPYRRVLERLAAGAANIRFLGAVAAGEIRHCLSRARALLVPSLFPETLGYVVLEAWSQGVPVLVSSAGALPELVAGGGGHVCGSVAAFADWIDRWTDDPDDAAETGATGWRRCRDEFDEERHVRRLVEVVRTCRATAVDSTCPQRSAEA